jgi:TetR/AcrR family transcriptional regulator
MGISERKEREKKRRREEILDAAEKVFFTRGIEVSTMDDVANEAELSKGTLYLYFKSKEDIHWAITHRGVKDLLQKMEKLVNPHKNAIENLLIIADSFIRFTQEKEPLANSIIFFEGCDIHKLNLDHDQIRESFLNDSPIHLVTEYVEKGIQQDLIRDDIPVNTLSNILWAQLIGVLQVANRKKELFDLVNITREDLIESHFKIALKGIKK